MACGAVFRGGPILAAGKGWEAVSSRAGGQQRKAAQNLQWAQPWNWDPWKMLEPAHPWLQEKHGKDGQGAFQGSFSRNP